MAASICWVVAETDTQLTIFDLSALNKQLLIFYLFYLFYLFLIFIWAAIMLESQHFWGGVLL
jgi:hypothetical protein